MFCAMFLKIFPIFKDSCETEFCKRKKSGEKSENVSRYKIFIQRYGKFCLVLFIYTQSPREKNLELLFFIKIKISVKMRKMLGVLIFY